jgi:hypothetical protein
MTYPFRAALLLLLLAAGAHSQSYLPPRSWYLPARRSILRRWEQPILLAAAGARRTRRCILQSATMQADTASMSLTPQSALGCPGPHRSVASGGLHAGGVCAPHGDLVSQPAAAVCMERSARRVRGVGRGCTRRHTVLQAWPWRSGGGVDYTHSPPISQFPITYRATVASCDCSSWVFAQGSGWAKHTAAQHESSEMYGYTHQTHATEPPLPLLPLCVPGAASTDEERTLVGVVCVQLAVGGRQRG